jgi:hypothetical protein
MVVSTGLKIVYSFLYRALAGRVVQAVECLLSKHEALSSNSSAGKKRVSLMYLLLGEESIIQLLRFKS